jgi:hypothetical protein
MSEIAARRNRIFGFQDDLTLVDQKRAKGLIALHHCRISQPN